MRRFFVLTFIITIQLLASQTLINQGSSWKYLDDGSDQGTAWRDLSFNDSSWSSGNAQLGYGDGDEATVISYGNDSNHKHICYYFRKTFNVTDPNANSGLKISLLRDDGAVVYINGQEVVRSNMPSGTISYTTLAAGTVSGSAEDTFNEYNISSSVLQSGQNIIAVEVHQRSASSSDVSFDLKLEFATINYYKKLPYVLLYGHNQDIRIGWQLNSTQPCTFEYGTDTTYSSGTINTTENNSTDHQHFVTLTNLTPDQKYYYRVTVNNTNEKTGSFQSFPLDTAQELTFFAYGDTRSNPSDHDDVAQAIMNDISTNNLKQTFILNSGDLVSNGDSESVWQDQFFDPQYTHISELLANLPYEAAVGNHEGQGALFGKYFPYYYQNNRYYYSFDYGPAHFTVIDQFVDYSVGSTQYNWIVNDLTSTNKLWKIAVFHEPGWSAGGHSNNTDVQNILQPLLEQYGVKIVLTGHNHYYARAVVNGVNHITTGGGGAPLYDPDATYPNIVKAEKTFHYCKLYINGNTLHFAAIKPDGSSIESFDITATPPDISVEGNSVEIADGDTTPSQIDATDFRHVKVNGSTVSHTFTIKNTGTDNLILNGSPVVSISGADASDFSVSQPSTTTVAGGSSTTFTIIFDPSDYGLRTATVTIDNNDPDEDTYNFDIQGIGADYTDCKGIAYIQDFETVPAQPELTYTKTQYIHKASNITASLYPTGENLYSSSSDALYINNHAGTVWFQTVDTRDYSDIEFRLRVASFSGEPDNGADAYSNTHNTGDHVEILVSTDDGNTWSEELEVTGKLGARWSFDTGTGVAKAAYDGDNVKTTFHPAAGGDRTTDGYSTMILTGLPSTEHLKIKVWIKNNNDPEYWIIDDARLILKKATEWDGSAWSNGAPDEVTKVILNGNYDTSNGDIHACDCEVKSGNTLTVSDGKYVEIESDIVNDGIILVNNQGSLVQHNPDAVLSGQGTYKLVKTALPVDEYTDYVFWSSPLNSTSFTLGDIVSNAWRYYKFDPNVSGGTYPGWVQLTDSDNPGKGIGYAISAPTGTNNSTTLTANFVKDHDPFNNGNITVNIYKKGTNAGDELNYNLLGNPYPSAIDFNALVADNLHVEGSYYLWTNCAGLDANGHHQSSGYTVYSTSGTATAACNDANNPTAGRYIATGQGFFVEANTDNSTLTFKNSQRVTGHNDNFANRPNSDNKVAWINMTDDTGNFNQIAVGFYTGATAGYDRLFDAHTMNDGTEFALYSVSGNHKLVINGLSDANIDGTTVPLTVEVSATSNLTISLDHQTGLDGYDIYLIDNDTQTTTDLKANDYVFNLPAGVYDGRFELVFNAVTSVDDQTLPDEAIVLSQQHGVFTLQSMLDNEQIQDLTVYDINGRVLFAKTGLNSQKVQVNLSQMSTGSILFFKVQTSGQKTVVKKAVKLK